MNFEGSLLYYTVGGRFLLSLQLCFLLDAGSIRVSFGMIVQEVVGEKAM